VARTRDEDVLQQNAVAAVGVMAPGVEKGAGSKGESAGTPDDAVSKVVAGEVVEQPASVQQVLSLSASSSSWQLVDLLDRRPRVVYAARGRGAGGRAMDEREWWLACDDPRPMLMALGRALGEGLGRWRSVSCTCCRTACARREAGPCPAYRKLRLFACACCRRVLGLLTDPVCLPALEQTERHADGLAEMLEYLDAVSSFDARWRARHLKYTTPEDAAWNALYCTVHRKWLDDFDDNFAGRRELVVAVVSDAARSAGEGEAAVQASLLREALGNPFRPAALDPAWLTRDVRALAQAAYEERHPPSGHLDDAHLAILADALEDAGCTDADLLGHLRGPGPHVRGCWAVDLLLGKE
jgi:hypothetical protein